MKRALAVLPMLAVPAAAQACAACGAIDRNRAIFLFTTIMLSLLPLALVGLGLLWLARRSKERLKAEFAQEEIWIMQYEGRRI